MLEFARLKAVYESPMPPMALTDYDALSKFLNQAMRRCKDSGRDFNFILDWAIHALVTSLAADSSSRIFLPKTKTAPFCMDDLIPLADIPANGQKRISLKTSHLIAPVWNNTDLELALETFYDSGFQGPQIEKPFAGAYIEELNLAIIDTPSDVDVPYILRVWGRGSILLDSYSLKSLGAVLRTDGDRWYIQDEDSESSEPVLDPRMAALYNCGLRRYVWDM